MPLSFAQQRMWFQEKRTPGTSAFHIPVRVTLHGSLNAAALEQTFAEIIRRHEILRALERALNAADPQDRQDRDGGPRR